MKLSPGSSDGLELLQSQGNEHYLKCSYYMKILIKTVLLKQDLVHLDSWGKRAVLESNQNQSTQNKTVYTITTGWSGVALTEYHFVISEKMQSSGDHAVLVFVWQLVTGKVIAQGRLSFVYTDF